MCCGVLQWLVWCVAMTGAGRQARPHPCLQRLLCSALSLPPHRPPQVPARSATLAEQEGTRKEIADLAQQSADLDALLEQRRQQFSGVLAALEQLQRSIDRDDPEESVVALPEGGAAGDAAAAVPSGQQQQAAMQVG